MKRKETIRENGTRRVQFFPVDSGLVEQSHKDSCDINSMIAKARRGVFQPPRSPGSYGDFTGVTDYHSARNQILAAEATFFALPSELRNRFNNDPQEVLDFIDDPENLEECYELGLIVRPEASPPSGGPVTQGGTGDPEPAVVDENTAPVGA